MAHSPLIHDLVRNVQEFVDNTDCQCVKQEKNGFICWRCLFAIRLDEAKDEIKQILEENK